MIVYPQIDPIALAIGPIAIRWYGLMYTVAFLVGWVMLNKRAQRLQPNWDADLLGDLVMWILVGVLLGGRLGYVIFYNASFYLEHPLAILRIWEGGMSFHGGLVGVMAAGYFFSRKHQFSFLAVTDLVTPVIPQGLFWGRIGNFINSELWGRVTDVPWGMVFPNGGPLPRHPSQLYEAFLEGVVLLILLHVLGRVERPRGFLLAVFLIGYSLCRFGVEFVREPDRQLGLLAMGLSMGQWLSTAMLLVGAALMLHVKRRL